ncbi:MAG: HAD-IIIA family hydrolase [Planctomycetota bacterium]
MLPAVFIDRDDTLIRNNDLPVPTHPPANWKPGDLYDPVRVKLMPGALEACRVLHDAGFVLIIVTNQGCVARGSATIAQVAAVNRRVRELLVTETNRGMIRAVYSVPFHPKGDVPGFTREHPWRKPSGGMLRQAARDLGLNLSRSWLIGDAHRDVEAGIHAGLPEAHCLRCGPEGAHPSVLDAAQSIPV